MTYGHKDRKNAHIKLMIWHNIMTFEHNDKKNIFTLEHFEHLISSKNAMSMQCQCNLNSFGI